MGTDEPQTANKHPQYLSYLLRLWREEEGPTCTARQSGTPTWRASVQNTLTSGQQGFASLDELVSFLRAQTGVSPESDASPDDAVV